MFVWQRSSCFPQWAPSCAAVESISYLCDETFFAGEKSRLFRDDKTFQHIVHVSGPRLHQPYGRYIRNFDIAVWEREQENMVLVASCAKFAQTPAMRTNVLDTGDKLVAEASHFEFIWGIGYRASNLSARQPSLWRVSRQDSANRVTSFPRSYAATDAPPIVVSSGRLALE